MSLVSPKVFALLLASPLVTTLLVPAACADTYKLYAVAETQSEHFVMGDDFGNYAFTSSVVSNHTNLCGTSSFNACYQVGNAVAGTSYFSSTVPAPLADPDASAGYTDLPTGPEWSVDRQLGNLFSGSYNPSLGYSKAGLWDGPDPVAGYLGKGSIDGGLASANGNVFFIDGANDTLVVGIDLQTSPVPEPGTLSLTATAMLSAAAVGRRRLQR